MSTFYRLLETGSQVNDSSGTSLGILSSIMAGCVLSDIRKTLVGAPLYKQGHIFSSLTLSQNFVIKSVFLVAFGSKLVFGFSAYIRGLPPKCSW